MDFDHLEQALRRLGRVDLNVAHAAIALTAVAEPDASHNMWQCGVMSRARTYSVFSEHSLAGRSDDSSSGSQALGGSIGFVGHLHALSVSMTRVDCGDNATTAEATHRTTTPTTTTPVSLSPAHQAAAEAHHAIPSVRSGGAEWLHARGQLQGMPAYLIWAMMPGTTMSHATKQAALLKQRGWDVRQVTLRADEQAYPPAWPQRSQTRDDLARHSSVEGDLYERESGSEESVAHQTTAVVSPARSFRTADSGVFSAAPDAPVDGLVAELEVHLGDSRIDASQLIRWSKNLETLSLPTHTPASTVEPSGHKGSKQYDSASVRTAEDALPVAPLPDLSTAIWASVFSRQLLNACKDSTSASSAGMTSLANLRISVSSVYLTLCPSLHLMMQQLMLTASKFSFTDMQCPLWTSVLRIIVCSCVASEAAWAAW